MNIISKNSVVTLDYLLKDENDNTLDSSEAASPIVYIQGSNNILPGIEGAVTGLKVEDEVAVFIAAADAYGVYEAEKVATVPRSALVGIEELEVGMQLQEDTGQGSQIITIKAVNDTEVVVDANHPLAGQDLYFELQIKAVRMATDEELEHGHVHGEVEHDH